MFSSRTRAVTFYVTMAAALVVLMTRAQLLVLPDDIGTQIGHNSEAFLFAILVCGEIQFLRGRLRTLPLLLGMVACGGLLIGLGLLLRASDLGPTIRTLNEPIVGAGFILLYLCLPRSRTVAFVTTVCVVVGIVVLFNTSFVLNQAESLVPLALTGIAIDVIYPELLTNEPTRHRGRQISWMLGLLVLAVVLMPLAHWARHHLTGPPEKGIDYLQRAAEGYWGWIFVFFFFVFWLDGRQGHPEVAPTDAPADTQADSGEGEDVTPPSASSSSVHVPRHGRHRAGEPLSTASSRLADWHGEQHRVG